VRWSPEYIFKRRHLSSSYTQFAKLLEALYKFQVIMGIFHGYKCKAGYIRMVVLSEQ
jgi:hypothetical protein